MLHLNDIAAFLDQLFHSARYGDDQHGVYRASDRPVRRLGLALEPWPGLGAWVVAERLDALWLHRPWQLSASALPSTIGVLADHLAFDEQLTLGYNPRLAAALGLDALDVLGTKDRRPIGMIGVVPPQPAAVFQRRVADLFGGLEATLPAAAPDGEVRRAAVVGAMTDALVRAAAAQGATMYLTGQLRQPARTAVADTAMHVLAVGHHRSELWGLHALAAALREHWPTLEVVVRDQGSGIRDQGRIVRE